MMKKNCVSFLVSILASISLSAYGPHKSNLVWNEESYAVTISGDILEKSKKKWDGASKPIPCKVDTAIGLANKWMGEHFQGQPYRFDSLTLFFFESSNSESDGWWAYIVGYTNGRKELIEQPGGRKAYKVDRMQFYVLMDGTLITPEKLDPAGAGQPM